MCPCPICLIALLMLSPILVWRWMRGSKTKRVCRCGCGEKCGKKHK